MRRLFISLILLISYPVLANGSDRYLKDNKVIYEDPQEDEILRINASIGYTTVLEFPEKPSMVTTGDSSLLQIEVPKNSRTVLIKALRGQGETNLFVFTSNHRFNYKVIVGDKQQVDYVIDVKETIRQGKAVPSEISIGQLLKMAQNYTTLKEHGQINERMFVQKDIFTQYDSPRLRLKMIEAFANKAPHYLVLHAVIHNMEYTPLTLNEKNTNVYVNGHKFTPQYVLFDSQTLGARQETDAWLVLENTHISLDNEFKIGVGVYDKEYLF